MKEYDVLVLGGGPAGVSAAIYAKRYNLNMALIASNIGGMIAEASLVDNWTGFFNITGAEIAKKLTEHLKYLKVEIKYENVEKIEKSRSGFTVKTEKAIYDTKAIIYALGNQHKKLDLPTIKKFEGKGVSYCATCDGPFYKNLTVAVVGGGNSAGRAVQLLLQHAKKVYLIHRGAKQDLKMDPALAAEIFANKKMEFIEKANVKELAGDKLLKEIRLDNRKKIAADGLFIEIGLEPQTQIAKSTGVKLDAYAHVVVDDEMKTNVKGFFAAGDVTDKNAAMRQAITSAAQGAVASLSAFKFLKKQ